MAAITQNDVLLDLSYLLSEQSIPTSGIDDRKAFIQRALERIYRLYDFNEFKSLATLSIAASGNFYTGNLPSDVGETPDLDIRSIVSGDGNDYIYEQIPYEDQDNWSTGDYKYWLTGSSGSYTFNSKDSNSNLICRYLIKAPTINASVSTTFPSSMIIARGALIYYRIAENPEADTQQEEAFFQRELQEVVAKQNRDRPRQRAISLQEKNGTYTGKV